LLGKRARPEL
jgi:hypothetical protein